MKNFIRLFKLSAGLCLILNFTMPATGICVAEEKVIFEFEVIATRVISGRFSTLLGFDREIHVDWGDGTREIFSGSRIIYRKDYGEKVDKTVKVYARSHAMLTEFWMNERNANIYFDVESLPPNLKNLNVTGQNTISGDISGLPPAMVSFTCMGNSTVSGDLSGLSPHLRTFRVEGGGIRGSLADLPENLVNLSIGGGNAVTGELSELPIRLNYFRITGKNTISGDLSELPGGLTAKFDCRGNNTITGNVADLPSGLEYFTIYGSHTVGGHIVHLPWLMYWLRVGEGHALEGDIKDLPDKIIFLDIREGGEISYSGGRVWAESIRQVSLGCDLTTEEVDDLIIGLAKTSWIGESRLLLRGDTAPRSDKSEAAVKKLKENNVSVQTN